jgi:hypothetical protein
MVIISLMILIIAIALTPSQATTVLSNVVANSSPLEQESGQSNLHNTKIGEQTGGLSPLLITRLTSIIFLFSGALAYNAFYIQSIGSGLSLYSGLFQVTALSQSFDLFVFILASLILLP